MSAADISRQSIDAAQQQRQRSMDRGRTYTQQQDPAQGHGAAQSAQVQTQWQVGVRGGERAHSAAEMGSSQLQTQPQAEVITTTTYCCSSDHILL